MKLKISDLTDEEREDYEFRLDDMGYELLEEIDQLKEEQKEEIDELKDEHRDAIRDLRGEHRERRKEMIEEILELIEQERGD